MFRDDPSVLAKAIEYLNRTEKGRGECLEKICYISGGMSGLPDYNFPAFNDCAAKLRADGWHVFNPAENFDGRTDLCAQRLHDGRFQASPERCGRPQVRDPGIVMLPAGLGRRGARVEVAMALEMGCRVISGRATSYNETTAESVKHSSTPASLASHSGRSVTSPPAKSASPTRRPAGRRGQEHSSSIRSRRSSSRRLAGVFDGSQKYSARNFEKGYAWSLSFDAMMRHLWAWWGGEETDPESGCNHMAHGIWHCFQLMLLAKYHRDLDDRVTCMPKGRNIPQDSQG